ncbi:Imm70 family immunity protein [Stenotrophomonas sp.]|uniref:Imm70 family immunity protein n=1 Tax=Stenotrophomonas sp. TaxID=69392 RepID=UPI0028AF042A|nr:Imm70 family immunity protein [Stenotrophomonas sp.]
MWRHEDRDTLPPWGREISKDITSLGNYFVTSSGRELIPLLQEVLTAASGHSDENRTIEMVQY